jgi:hypothetical protein
MTRAARRVIALSIVAGPLILLGVTTAAGRPHDAGLVVALTALSALAVGAGARWLESPLRPAQGGWLDAIRAARAAILRSEPDDAIREALRALREPAGVSAVSPELWTLHPVRVATIDAAGYVQEKEATLPDDLLPLASGEPEATLRTDVLHALVVRRPELRALARWMEERGAMCATVVTRAGEAEGVLVLPRGPRVEALALEEARALKGLADALASAIFSRGALQRSMAREREASARAEEAAERAARMSHEVELGIGRNALATQRLARPAAVGGYAAASRMAFDAIERRVRAGAPVALVAPSGVDPVPYLARAHLGGPRAGGPLVLVDGTSSREHDVARWSDPKASPLALADSGMLVLLDGAALAVDVQRLIARALAERRAPWERPTALDVALAFTATLPPQWLVSSSRLDPLLASRLGDAEADPIRLPRLGERAEDIRAILTDRLAREGMRVRGAPIGIDDGAFARLVEYPFLGEDAELASIVQRLVARVSGDVVRARDVDELGLSFGAPAHSSRGGLASIP